MAGVTDFHPADECIWLGDLSGFTIESEPDSSGASTYLMHRCGWQIEIRHQTEHLPYLGNIVQAALAHMKRTCAGDKE